MTLTLEDLELIKDKYQSEFIKIFRQSVNRRRKLLKLVSQAVKNHDMEEEGKEHKIHGGIKCADVSFLKLTFKHANFIGSQIVNVKNAALNI